MQKSAKFLVNATKLHKFRKIITYVKCKIEFSNPVFRKIRNIEGSLNAITKLLISAEFVLRSPVPLTTPVALIPPVQ